MTTASIQNRHLRCEACYSSSSGIRDRTRSMSMLKPSEGVFGLDAGVQASSSLFLLTASIQVMPRYGNQ